MKPSLSWEDVLKRDDVVGGHLEIHKTDDSAFAGPIKSIRKEVACIYIQLEWTAWKSLDLHQGYTLANNMEWMINADIPPTDVNCEYITFRTLANDFGIIFLKGGISLDPSKVEGLRVV